MLAASTTTRLCLGASPCHLPPLVVASLGRGDLPSVVDQRFVARKTFDTTVDRFDRYDAQGLSFTDATTVALVERHDVDHGLSFEDDFDGLVDRLDPDDLG